jgi:hypothetical protein
VKVHGAPVATVEPETPSTAVTDQVWVPAASGAVGV